MKNYRNFTGYIKHYVLCLYIYQYNGNDLLLFNDFYLLQTFCCFFFDKCYILLHIGVILVLFLLMVTNFFFLKSIIFLCVFLKIYNIFSYKFLCNINYTCFLYDQISKLFTLSTLKEYVFLFLWLKIFLGYFYSYLFF